MGVRIVANDSLDECPTTDYVRVRTYAAPEDDTVTLATIQRFVEKTNGEAWKVRTLLEEQPMSAAEAMGFATCYAERKHIPVVVKDSDCEIEGRSRNSADLR